MTGFLRGKDDYVIIFNLWNNGNQQKEVVVRRIAELITILMVLVAFNAYSAMEVKTLAVSAPLSTVKNNSDDIIHVMIVGPKNDKDAIRLYNSAMSLPKINMRVAWWDRSEGPLINTEVTYPELDRAAAYVCFHFQCSLPIFTADNLLNSIVKLSNEPEEKKPSELSAVKKQPYAPFDSNNYLAENNWLLIILIFTGLGLLLSFSPCILPLIPIMASIIVGQSIGVKKERTVLLTLAYILSMALTYAFLGIFAGVFGVYIQAYLQKTWIIILFSSVFFMLAMTMLANHQLQLPRFIQNKINDRCSSLQGGSYLSVIGMGILATLIVSPCVTAPLAGVLGFIAKTGNYITGGVALFFLGIGMGIPLLIVSIFSRNILPKAVRWNKHIRNFCALILLGMSIWMSSRVITEFVCMLTWAGFFILVSIYMGLYKNKTIGLWQKLWKTLTVMVFIYGISIFIYAMFTQLDLWRSISSLAEQPKSQASQQATLSFVMITNANDLQQAISTAQTKHQPIMLDFTAKWCTSCAEIEKNIFKNPAIIKALNNFYLLRVDLTNSSADSIKIAQQFNVVAPPVIIFFSSEGTLLDLRANGDISASQFQELLQKVK